MKRFVAALRFLTVVPIPGGYGTGMEPLARSAPFFPVVGLLIGLALAVLAWALSLILWPPIVSVLLVIALAAATAGLHLDGLSDTADGFLSSRPRERILEIMKDSHVGAMGVIAIVCVLLLKTAALMSMPAPGMLWRAVLLAPVAGRCAMVISMTLLPYARPEGLGSVFYMHRSRWNAVWAAAFLAASGYAVAGAAGLIGAGAALAVVLVFAAQCRRKIGGATGDTLGAACELAETTTLLVLSIRQLGALAG